MTLSDCIICIIEHSGILATNNSLTIFKSLYCDVSTKGTSSNRCSGSYNEGIGAERCQRVQRKVEIGRDVLNDIPGVQGCGVNDVICNDPIPILHQRRIPCQNDRVRALCHSHEILWRTTGNCRDQKKEPILMIIHTYFTSSYPLHQ